MVICKTRNCIDEWCLTFWCCRPNEWYRAGSSPTCQSQALHCLPWSHAAMWVRTPCLLQPCLEPCTAFLPVTARLGPHTNSLGPVQPNWGPALSSASLCVPRSGLVHFCMLTEHPKGIPTSPVIWQRGSSNCCLHPMPPKFGTCGDPYKPYRMALQARSGPQAGDEHP